MNSAIWSVDHHVGLSCIQWRASSFQGRCQ